MVADLTFWAPRRPEPGETLLGTRFEQFLGGKGFNQALAARRAGADALLIGAVGRDSFGTDFLEALASDGMTRDGITQVDDGTGVGQPLVTADGEVSIIGIPRANARLDAAWVRTRASRIEAADSLMLQCEVPLSASLEAAQIARRAGVRVIVNPAPAGPDGRALAELADLLIVNQLEASMLLGAEPGTDPGASGRAVSDEFGCVTVVTLGAAGALLVADDGSVTNVAPHAVETVDPTGAGDAFVGAITVAISEGHSPIEALRFANAAGSLAVEVAGAAPSMPTRAAIDARCAMAATPRDST